MNKKELTLTSTEYAKESKKSFPCKKWKSVLAMTLGKLVWIIVDKVVAIFFS